MRRDEPAIGVLRAPRRYALGDDAALGVLAEMDHLGAAVDLLAAVRHGDRIELALRIVAAQNAGRIFPGDRRSRLDLRPADVRIFPATIAAFRHEIIDAAAALAIAGIPVLHRRIFDLGVVERDQFHHRRVQLILVALGRRAAFEIADVRPGVGDDQRALELSGVLLVDAEISGQFHRAAHARRHVNEGAVGIHRRVQRREEIVAHRHDRAEIFAHEFGVLAHGLRDRAKNHAGPRQLLLKSRRDGDAVEHRVDRHPAHLDAGENLLLAQGNPQLLVSPQKLGIDVFERGRPRRRFGRRVIIEVLIVDARMFDARPIGLGHGQPSAIGRKPPVGEPLRLVLLGRDEADDVFGKTLRGLVRFDVGREPVFIGVDVDGLDGVNGLFESRHLYVSSSRRVQGPSAES